MSNAVGRPHPSSSLADGVCQLLWRGDYSPVRSPDMK